MRRDAWTREQLLSTLALYCQIPFGKMDQRNPDVIELANSLGRTPGAVAFKLGNFASFDPEMQLRGVGGLPNTSKLDHEIWDEFYGRWDVLAERAVLQEFEALAPSSGREQTEPLAAGAGSTEILREVKLRHGQTFFRASVLAAYDEKCCITGISSPALLRAGHIVPWSKDESLRLDPRNGLCLNALHDAAFDRGFITLNTDYELIVSKRLRESVPDRIYGELFGDLVGRSISLPERFKPSTDALAFHRSEVFQG